MNCFKRKRNKVKVLDKHQITEAKRVIEEELRPLAHLPIIDALPEWGPFIRPFIRIGLAQKSSIDDDKMNIIEKESQEI